MKRHHNLLHFYSNDISSTVPKEIRRQDAAPHSWRHSKEEDFEVTSDLDELFTRQGIVFFKDRALDRLNQIPANF